MIVRLSWVRHNEFAILVAEEIVISEGQVLRNVRVLSDLRFREGVKLGKGVCARSIKLERFSGAMRRRTIWFTQQGIGCIRILIRAVKT